MPHIRVGISGWTYAPWRGRFYPKGLPQRLELAYASRRFNALEINGVFYSLMRPRNFADWYDQTPPGFVFTLKGGRYITHMRKLNAPLVPLANYLASGPLLLREKLGPILWQFPPFLSFNLDKFKAFFDLLPHDTAELARVAKQHAPFLKGRVHLEPDAIRPVRHAVEFRHESFLSDAFINLLREHRIALVVADVASKYPTAEDVTADWVYVRLHGSRKLYVSGYTPREIDRWSKRIRAWHEGAEPDAPRLVSSTPPPSAPQGRDVFVFFDNTDVKLRAPIDARNMAKKLGVGPAETPEKVMKNLGVGAKKSPPRAKTSSATAKKRPSRTKRA